MPPYIPNLVTQIHIHALLPLLLTTGILNCW